MFNFSLLSFIKRTSYIFLAIVPVSMKIIVSVATFQVDSIAHLNRWT